MTEKEITEKEKYLRRKEYKRQMQHAIPDYPGKLNKCNSEALARLIAEDADLL